MRKKPAMARASLLQELAATKAGPLVILASTGDSPVYDPKAQLAAHKCTACGTQFSAVAGIEPFCANCGSEQVQASAEEQKATLPKTDENMCFATCASCKTHNILGVQHATTLKGLMHCASCGDEITFQLASDDSPVLLDHADASDVEGEIENAVEADLGINTETDLDGEESADEAGKPLRLDFADQSEVEDELPSETADATEDQADALNDDIGVTRDDADLTDGLQQLDDEMVLQTAGIAKIATVDLVKSNTIALAHVGDNVVAFVDGKHVATLTPETAGAMKDEMYESVFADAVQHVASTEGVKAALANFGFKNEVLRVPLGRVAASLAAKKVTEQVAAVKDKSDKLGDAFLQSMSIAAAGLNKGFFVRHSNPVKASVVDQLKLAGVQGAERLVAKAFNDSGDSYNRTLITLANELMGKTADARNEIAEAIGCAAPESASMNEEDDAGEQQTATVMPFRPSEVNAGVDTMKTRAVGQVQSVRAKLGGKLF